MRRAKTLDYVCAMCAKIEVLHFMAIEEPEVAKKFITPPGWRHFKFAEEVSMTLCCDCCRKVDCGW